MGNKAGEVSGDQTVAAVNAKPGESALLTRQEGRILSKWLEKEKGQLNMVTAWTWEIKGRIKKLFPGIVLRYLE